jgi:serine phosphatase RsbU (regulator of sigma subunit)
VRVPGGDATIEEPSTMPWLKMLQGGTPGTTYSLDREAAVLGRDTACDISLASHEVSKRHSRIVRKGEAYHIEDLQSTNGTRVNEADLTEPRRLEDGDLIEIGDFRFVFVEDDQSILSVLDASSTDFRRVARVRPEEKLVAVLEIARDLGGTIDLDGVLGNVLEALFRIFPRAERGFILLRGVGADELVLKASKVRDPEEGPPIFSRTVFRHVTDEGQAVLCQDVGADPRFHDSPSVRESRIRTMICVPLRDREQRPFGVLQIDTRDEPGRFEPDDLDLLGAVAGPVGVAIENARLHEAAVTQKGIEQEARDARSVQRALIPKRTPQVPGYEFWHHYQPARFVGGDYFNYLPLFWAGQPDHLTSRWALAVGDVAGKGMPAALLMAKLSSEVGLLLQAETDPARVVGRLNRHLCETGNEERFITFLLALIDPDRHELTVVNAGHMDPIIRRSDGSIEVIGQGVSGTPLGACEGRSYEPVGASIGHGDVIVLYTDGISDAMNSPGNPFGEERLKQAIASAPARAGSVGGAVLSAVRQHVAGHAQFDDMTLLCFGRS